MKPINLTGRNNPGEDGPESIPRESLPWGWKTRLSAKAQSSIICFLLALVTFAVFSPALQYDFVNFDDPKYVTESPIVLQGLSAKGLAWAFTSHHASNWHPLTWLSHMLDVQCFGLRPGWHHLTNILLHAASTVFLFLALNRMTKAIGPSAFVAGLFALHPLHVESVAWVSERKDVLSAFFFMLTIWAYARYAELAGRSSGDAKPGCLIVSYGLVLLFFALGLMSKPMLVTVPFILLLLDYWPLRRIEPIGSGRDWPRLWGVAREKLPLLVLVCISCVLTLRAQRAGGAVASLDLVPLGSRLANAVTGYLGYLQKMFWPTDLTILYLPPHEWPPGLVLLSVVLLTTLTVGALIAKPSSGYLTVGWFWFLGMLVPVIGLVQVGDQWIADRYTYLPLIGLFIALTWGARELARRWPRPSLTLASVATALLVVATAVTSRQLAFWRDSEALFNHCCEVAPENCIAHNNLGNALVRKGKYQAAQWHYREALRLEPRYSSAMLNLGILLTQQGQIDEALQYLREATRHGIDCAGAYARMGLALESQGNVAAAIIYYREGLGLRPDQPEACNNLAWILATHGDPSVRNGNEAVTLAERACRLTEYGSVIPLGTLAAAYAEVGRFPEAVETAQKAIRLASSTSQAELAQRNRELLQLYSSGKAYHQSE